MAPVPVPISLIDAQRNQVISSQYQTVGDEPLQCVMPDVAANKYLLVTLISAICKLIHAPSPNPCWGPAISFFLVPTAQAPETLAEAQASLPLHDRIIPLDTRVQLFTDSSGQNTLSMVWRGVQLEVPPGYTITGIVDVNPGNAAPGPGAGSTMQMTVIGSLEDQAGC